MLRNILNCSKSLFKNKPVNANKTNSLHSSALVLAKAKNLDEDQFQYQQDASSGIRNLENLNLAKAHWSWPQYNRVIYPPSQDGKPLKNPVT
jgi:hypothetical protein